MKKIWEFITSSYLCVLTGISFAAGGLLLSLGLNFQGGYFSTIDSITLVDWVTEKVKEPFSYSIAAFFLVILITFVLFSNALLCTSRRLYHISVAKGGWKRYIPHVMHIAFLIVVAGHLVSSLSAEKVRSIPVLQGGYRAISGTPLTIFLEKVDMTFSDRGYPTELSADITVFNGGELAAAGKAMVNNPVGAVGYQIYIKDVRADMRGRKYAIIDANRDPGAPVVLAGAILFTLANLVYLLFCRAGGD